MVSVKKIDERTFEVTVQGRTTTKHEVTVEPSYYETLTSGNFTPEKLMVKSFEFLHEMEPNTSILRKFDLSVIRQFFPEYEREIQKIMGK